MGLSIRIASLPVVLAILSACRATPQAPGTTSVEAAGVPGEEETRLEAFFDDYLDFLFRASPSTATALGDHRRDAELDDVRAEAIDEREAGLATFLDRMPREIDRARLGVAGRADYDILRNEIEAGLFTLRKLRPFERDPMTYSGLLTQPVYDLLKRDFAPLDERVGNAVARMKRIPAVVEAARRNLRSPPKPQTEVALRQIRGAATFYESGLADFVKGSSGADEALAEGKRLAAVLREYADWVEKDLLPRATDEWRLGKELWEEKLRYSLNSSLGPDEIQARARSEFDRVRAEMYVLSKALWQQLFEGTALPQGDEALRTTVKAVVDAA